MSDRGKTTANPDGFARILTMDRRKYARQNHGSDIYSHPILGTTLVMIPKLKKKKEEEAA